MSFDKRLEDYITVAERIAKFKELYPEGALQSEIVHIDETKVVMRAYAYRTTTDPRPGIGHAEKLRGSTPVNRTSALENCETSAWGRALAALGLEVKKGFAPREEIEKARRTEEILDGVKKDATVPQKQTPSS